MTTHRFPTNLSLPINSLDSYFLSIQKIDFLSLQEEQQLARQLKEKGDLDAARRLVMTHLRFVVKIARGYSGYGLSQADLIQEGNIGLMKAVKRFDVDMGVRLASFAVHWIKAEIHEFILRNWRIVKIATTKAQRKLFFKLRNSKKRLGWFSATEINEVAENLGVKPDEVRTMEARLNYAHDIAYDTPSKDSDSLPLSMPADYLVATEADPAEAFAAEDAASHQHSHLRTALLQLDNRSQEIIQKRWLDEKKTTLTTLAKQFNVSAERIRQLEKKAFAELQTLLR